MLQSSHLNFSSSPWMLRPQSNWLTLFDSNVENLFFRLTICDSIGFCSLIPGIATSCVRKCRFNLQILLKQIGQVFFVFFSWPSDFWSLAFSFRYVLWPCVFWPELRTLMGFVVAILDEQEDKCFSKLDDFKNVLLQNSHTNRSFSLSCFSRCFFIFAGCKMRRLQTLHSLGIWSWILECALVFKAVAGMVFLWPWRAERLADTGPAGYASL